MKLGLPNLHVCENEQHIVVGTAEREIGNAWGHDLAKQVAFRRKDLNTGCRRRVDAALRVDLDAVGDAGADDGDQAFVPQVAAIMDVEGKDMMWQPDNIGTRRMSGAAVRD